MTNSEKALSSWKELKEKLLANKKTSDSWLELKIEVVNIINERFLEAMPGISRKQINPSNEKIIDILDRAANGVFEYQRQLKYWESKNNL